MAYPGQPAPSEQTPNASQGMDTGLGPRDSNQFGDEKDHMLDANEIQTLEHGGYGGEQEYLNESISASQPGGAAISAEGAYVNQTDMTDQTGDRSQSESMRQSSGHGQGQPGDEGLAYNSAQEEL